jgi:hypothetical protein
MNYKAPWSKLLIGTSILCTAACLAPLVASLPKLPPVAVVLVKCVPLLFIVGTALFTIRSYSISAGSLFVQRMFWSTQIQLSGLKSAQFDPRAMKGSIRTFGNGGFFAISGWYWSKRLGAYRAWVTDPKKSVILEFEKRKIVVSPETPEQFVDSIMKSGVR